MNRTSVVNGTSTTNGSSSMKGTSATNVSSTTNKTSTKNRASITNRTTTDRMSTENRTSTANRISTMARGGHVPQFLIQAGSPAAFRSFVSLSKAAAVGTSWDVKAGTSNERCNVDNQAHRIKSTVWVWPQQGRSSASAPRASRDLHVDGSPCPLGLAASTWGLPACALLTFWKHRAH